LEGREGMTLEFSLVGRGFEGEGEFCERVPPREIAEYGNSVEKSVLIVLIIYKTGASEISLHDPPPVE